MSYRDRKLPFEGGVSPYAPLPSPDAPGRSRDTAISITELNDATRTIVESSFGKFWVRGEVSDFKRYRSGHWYFSLRDSMSQMSCVVWASDQRGIPAPPDDGMQVVAQAQLAFYSAKGTLQLRINKLEAAGDGLWRKAMQLTIANLTADGLMAAERKRPLPRYPRCVAVVTSTSGAAIRDIISVAHRRRPGMRIVVASAIVQGDEAPRSICRAIERVGRWGYADVIIVGRGGGSREDLWAFNDERVARAIAKSRVPVISAIGHEIDTTVCDLVADARAATPSVAAETAIPALADMQAELLRQGGRLSSSIQRRRDTAAADLRRVAREMKLATVRAAEQRRNRIGTVAGRLNDLSPLAVLSRGYAVARGAGGRTLSRVEDFLVGDKFDLLVSDGVVSSIVRQIEDRTEKTGLT